MFKKKLKNFFIKPISIIIIPDSRKKPKQFKLIKALVVIPFIIFIAFFSYTVYQNMQLTKANKDLSAVLTIKTDDIHSQDLVIERQKNEIAELENTTTIVKNKLSQLYDLEAKVRTMVGLEASSVEPQNKLLTSEMATEDFDPSTEDLAKILQNEYAHYDDFIASLEKQLDYLDAKPDLWPVKGKITSKFGYRIHPITNKKQFHKGIDIANSLDTDVKTAGSGIVTFSGWNGGYGNVIKISHGYGYQTVYAHNNKLLVKVGDKVEKGDIISKLGSTGRSTGPHVHFEIHFNGQQINPLGILKDNE